MVLIPVSKVISPILALTHENPDLKKVQKKRVSRKYPSAPLLGLLPSRFFHSGVFGSGPELYALSYPWSGRREAEL